MRHAIALAFVAGGCTDVLGFDELADSQPCVRDTFDDGDVDITLWDSFGQIDVRDGRVQLVLPPSIVTSQGLVSATPRDLTGGSFEVDVTKSVNQAGGAQNLLAGVLDADHALVVAAKGGQLLFGAITPQGLTGGAIAFDPRLVHWRIRHAATDNTLHFETATALGDDWLDQGSFPSPFSVTTLFIQLEADSLDPAPANPGTAEFDNFTFSSPSCR